MLNSRVQSVTPTLFGCKFTKRFPNICPLPTYLTPFQCKIAPFSRSSPLAPKSIANLRPNYSMGKNYSKQTAFLEYYSIFFIFLE